MQLDFASLHTQYKKGAATPSDIIAALYERIANYADPAVWISLVPRDKALARARKLELEPLASARPLYGVPFAVKDNIDIAGLPTTAGCPAYSFQPPRSAAVVQNLVDAGAIPVGKTNLDQFATGLVGTRSPHGACSSVFDKRYISGGSSSGSAVAVAAGLASFSLGTDTAGSGRVPAAFNNLVGLKPTRGLLSTRGVVPACRTLDCVSVFASNCRDAHTVFTAARGFDPEDSFSREACPGEGAAPWAGGTFCFGVPSPDYLEFFGDDAAPQLDAMTFGLGSGIAGVAGVALSQLTNVGPNLGQSYIIDSFMVVVFGGVGNLWGTFIGGMSMGVVSKLLEPYADAVLAKIVVLVALILFIQRRPRGLFPQTGRAAEGL